MSGLVCPANILETCTDLWYRRLYLKVDMEVAEEDIAIAAFNTGRMYSSLDSAHLS